MLPMLLLPKLPQLVTRTGRPNVVADGLPDAPYDQYPSSSLFLFSSFHPKKEVVEVVRVVQGTLQQQAPGPQ